MGTLAGLQRLAKEGEIRRYLLSGPRPKFKANEAFQKRMRDSGVKDHAPTKIVTLKVRLGDGEHVNPGVHFFQEGEKSGTGVRDN
jgi:hypothetical protein